MEIVNTATETAKLDNYFLRDSTANNKKILTGEISGGSYLKIDFSNYLNKDGDTVRLLVLENSSETETDKIEYGEKAVCPGATAESVGRWPDLSGSVAMLSPATPGGNNSASTVVACQVPSPTQKPTATPKPPATEKPAATPKPSVTSVNTFATDSLFQNRLMPPEATVSDETEEQDNFFSENDASPSSDLSNSLSGTAAGMVLGEKTNLPSAILYTKYLINGLSVLGTITGFMGLFATVSVLKRQGQLK